MQLLAIAVLLLGILTASAVKNPDDVCFRLNIKQGPWVEDTGRGTNDGRWHANGAFVDAGTVHDEYQMIPDGSKAGMLSYYTMTVLSLIHI